MPKGRAKFWIVVGTIFVALVAMIYFGRPFYRSYRESHSLKQARAFLQKNDLPNAVLCLRRVLILNSTNLEAASLMANVMSAVRSPTALARQQRVVQLSPTLENKIQLTAVALQFERPPFPIASQTLDELQTMSATNVAYHLLASQLALRRNLIAEAEAHLEIAARLEPTNRLHQLNLAVLRLRSTDKTKMLDAKNKLSALISDPQLGQFALRSLIADDLISGQFADAKQLSDQLISSPHAQFEDKLQRATILYELHGSEMSNWIATIETSAATNIVEIAETTEWFLAHNQPRQVLDWFSSLPQSVRDSVPLPFLKAESYAALKDWDGLENWLEKERWGDQEFFRFAWLARAFREQNRNEIADIHWQRALSAAEPRIEYQIALAQIVASWNWNDETEELLRAIVKRDPRQNWAWQNLLQRRTAAKDTTGLYQLYSAIFEQQTNSPVVKNNLAMLGLLLNRDTSHDIRLAGEVFEADTNNPHFASTYAFALLKQNKSAEGLRLMETLPKSELLQPEIAIYYAVLLSANGRREAAAPYFVAAGKAEMLPEEKQLLEKYR
jgi:predicted Zn-dependent protease